MMLLIESPMPSLTGKPASATKFSSFVVRTVWIISLSTLLVFLILLSSGHFRLWQSGISLIGSLVYTAFISLPSIFLLTSLSVRCAGRIPRLLVLMQAFLLICTSTAGTFAGAAVLEGVGIVQRGHYWFEVRAALPFCIVIALIFGLSISTFETLRYNLQDAQLKLRTGQMEQERANKLIAEARLSSLESRIHPHFLFNTLNSIASLIPSDPVRAEDTVGKLASLLRFSLNASHASLVPLNRELRIVRDYLEIEQTRFGSRLQYEMSIPAEIMEAKIPPLALQTVVENSVKHVVAQRPQGAIIEVIGTIDSGCIRLTVLDNGPGFSLDAITPDHGLGNLISRMELLYGDSGQLTVSRVDDKTSVSLTFPA